MIQDPLSQLGVHADLLTDSEKDFLRTQGYLNLGKLLSDETVEILRNKIEELLQQEGDRAGIELEESPNIRHPKDPGSVRLGDLVNKGPEFDCFYTQPKVLAAISFVLGNSFKLSSLNFRAALPGAGLQKLHADWPEAVKSDDFKVCNSIWLLDDFHAENGATRVVPGTHLKSKLPQDEMENPMDAHPDEIIIQAPAGSVVIFNSHTWHGGTTNRTSVPRRAIHSYFCRRDQVQQINQAQYFREATRNRISPAALQLLGISEHS
ncbi:Ectoine hydroxylase-related dioxygenase, phytanoyl-CoA dioxygenase (PhyH) family [Cyclobacterium xiamenense]|uniref:Ectoine hydroxylase-related dioxygenase, phytanoyl-CoA dioxygenase (PhyH) family n=1 Tax=Cyclobacterium xiamenense TaxID=1297121 RepID=A0A1H7BZZ9_9BACT|nr:phytanoyl-CoA dioxygenase family protein [Cyclobacterium xiamenense]SEJ79940.1 Ectoine hydroxylase-related dioxygenase, phytanoyl-CoA dioxygenase (PhyH) family [Cyclobacterium xiamenense]